MKSAGDEFDIGQSFGGHWLLRHGTPLPGRSSDETYRSLLVFFSRSQRHYVASFSREGDFNYLAPTIGAIAVIGDRLHYSYEDAAGVTRFTRRWKKLDDGSFTIFDPGASYNYVPGSFEAALAQGFDRRVFETFLAEAKREGWVIDPVARMPDVPAASKPAKRKSK